MTREELDEQIGDAEDELEAAEADVREIRDELAGWQGCLERGVNYLAQAQSLLDELLKQRSLS